MSQHNNSIVITRDNERWTATYSEGAGWIVSDEDGDYTFGLPDVELTTVALEIAVEAWWAGYATAARIAAHRAA